MKTALHSVSYAGVWPGQARLSLDDFVVSFFTSGPGSTTLPILIYASVKRGVTPDINALSALLLLASIAGTVSVMLFQSSRTPKNLPV